MVKVIGWRADDNEQAQVNDLKKALSIKTDSQVIRMAVAELYKKNFPQPGRYTDRAALPIHTPPSPSVEECKRQGIEIPAESQEA